jgi:hypothetical protein
LRRSGVDRAAPQELRFAAWIDPKDQARQTIMSAANKAPKQSERRPERGGAGRAADQGVTTNSRGEEQPKDKSRAQQTSGEQAQRDAAREQPPSPGEPAGGE